MLVLFTWSEKIPFVALKFIKKDWTLREGFQALFNTIEFVWLGGEIIENTLRLCQSRISREYQLKKTCNVYLGELHLNLIKKSTLIIEIYNDLICFALQGSPNSRSDPNFYTKDYKIFF